MTPKIRVFGYVRTNSGKQFRIVQYKRSVPRDSGVSVNDYAVEALDLSWNVYDPVLTIQRDHVQDEVNMRADDSAREDIFNELVEETEEFFAEVLDLEIGESLYKSQ